MEVLDTIIETDTKNTQCTPNPIQNCQNFVPKLLLILLLWPKTVVLKFNIF